MGNIHSHPHSHPHSDSLHSHTVHLTKRSHSPRSPRLSRKLSCITSAWSSDDSLPSVGSTSSSLDEKFAASIGNILTRPDDRQDIDATKFNAALSAFQDLYPEYRQTWILDSLRLSDYTRLTRTDETYVDYMGGAIFPESLVRIHSDFLSRNIMGNTHSISNSSQTSTNLALEARQAVLDFFKAPSGYTVIFTANATAAIKLVGESFPFREGGAFVLGTDSHNSINGIRRFAAQGGAKVCYLGSTNRGGVDLVMTENVLIENRPSTTDSSPCLFALTGLSNISNSKNPLSLLDFAKSLGYKTLLDAAALATTSQINLTETPVDAMAVSFYKMFGFPTGVGALVVKEEFLSSLQRPWFAGGTVDVVQVPGSIVTMAEDVREQFEDGTINYLSLPAVTQGLQFLSTYLPFLPIRLSALLHHLTSSLENLRHDTTGLPVVRILSRLPSRRVRELGDQADTGSTVSLLFLDPKGDMIPNSFVEHAAVRQKISLRTGCVCNPGGAAAILGIEEKMMELRPDSTLKDFELHVGHELGVVRISLGLASSFSDVWKVLQFATCMGTQSEREKLWKDWKCSNRPLH